MILRPSIIIYSLSGCCGTTKALTVQGKQGKKVVLQKRREEERPQYPIRTVPPMSGPGAGMARGFVSKIARLLQKLASVDRTSPAGRYAQHLTHCSTIYDPHPIFPRNRLAPRIAHFRAAPGGSPGQVDLAWTVYPWTVDWLPALHWRILEASGRYGLDFHGSEPGDLDVTTGSYLLAGLPPGETVDVDLLFYHPTLLHASGSGNQVVVVP